MDSIFIINNLFINFLFKSINYLSIITTLMITNETASCVLICMTEKYKESNNCRMEAEFTIQKKNDSFHLSCKNHIVQMGGLVLYLDQKYLSIIPSKILVIK